MDQISRRRFARGAGSAAPLKGTLQHVLLDNETLSSGHALHHVDPLGRTSETIFHQTSEAQNLTSGFAETPINDDADYNYTSGDLWRENEAFALVVSPSMVYVAMLMAVGVPGNGLAVYVYGVQFRVATQNFLIVCLAVFDLIIGLIAMPTEIADLRFHLTFSSDFACRLLRFLTLFCALSSNCILVVIALDRYRRVCHPLRRQMTVREARVGAGLSVALSLLLAWPLFVITGLRTAETSKAGLYGKDCSFSDEFKNTAYPLALMSTLGAGFVVMAGVLAALYSGIWRKARAHRAGWSLASGCGSSHPKVKVKASSTSSLPGSPTSPTMSEIESGSSVMNATPAISTITLPEIESSASPLKSSPSLLKRSLSPSKSCPSPLKKSPSPSKSCPSPLRRSSLPSRSSPSPLKKSPLPSRSSPSPLKRSPSPSRSRPSAVNAAQITTIPVSEIENVSSATTATITISTLPEIGNSGPPVAATVRSTILSSPTATDITTATPSTTRNTQLNGLAQTAASEPNVSIITPRSDVAVNEVPTKSQSVSINSRHKARTARQWPKLFKKGKNFSMDKTTLVAFTVTLVFVLSFLPYLTLMLVRGVVRDFDHSLRGSVQLNFYNIFVRSYLLNSAANPVIYGVFNARFRLEVVTLFRKMTSLLCCCRR